MTKTVLASHHGMTDGYIPGFFLMTDDDRLPDPSAVIGSLPGGSAIIVRSRSAKSRIAMAERLDSICKRQGVALLVSCDEPAEFMAGDGVHVPEAARRHWRRRDFIRLRPALVTTSAHSLKSALDAANWGADAVMLSPVLPTKSHPDAQTLGWCRAGAIARALSIPVIALGGINPTMNARAHELGFAGIAGIGMFANP